MAMDTYDDLVEKVKSWLNRENFPKLDIEIEDLMAMAQRRIYRKCDFKIMEKKVDFLISAPTVPTDYLRTKVMRYAFAGGIRQIKGAPLNTVLVQGQSGLPYIYAIEAGQFVFGPVANGDYDVTLTYYYPLPLLSPTNQTNWFSENIPELILFSSLVEAALWLKDDARTAVWEGRFNETKNEQELSEQQADKEPGSMQVRRNTSVGFEGNEANG